MCADESVSVRVPAVVMKVLQMKIMKTPILMMVLMEMMTLMVMVVLVSVEVVLAIKSPHCGARREAAQF